MAVKKHPGWPTASAKFVASGIIMLDARPAFEVPVGDAADRKAPTEFRLFSAGMNATDKGDFLFDEEAAECVMSVFAEKGVELSMDYEHQSLVRPPIEAPASGWFTPEVRNGELWACNVRWTDKARAYLESKGAPEYRYFSPALNFDKATKRVLQLVNAALTNNPAMHGIAPLMAASANAKENDMDPKDKLIEELQAQVAALEAKAGETQLVALTSTVGLKADASISQVSSAVSALVSFRKEVLGIAGKDTDGAALGALTGMRENSAEVVGLRAKIAEQDSAALKAEFDGLLDAAGKDGKLPPAKRSTVEKLALSAGGGSLTRAGIDAAKECISLLTPAVNTVETPGAEASVELSAIEEEIAARTGGNKEALKKRKVQKLTGRAS